MSEDLGWSGLPAGEPIPGKTYRADGWVYRDPPGKFAPEFWAKLLAIIGEGNYVVLAESRGVTASGKAWLRGQLLVSPAGLVSMESFVASGGSTQ